MDGVDIHYEIPGDARGWVSDRQALITRRYERAYWGISAVASARGMLPRNSFDVVIANDLNTVPLALSLNPRRGVHADLHEFAPREKESERTWRMFVAPYMRWLCRRYLPQTASATTVSQGIARQYEKDYGVHFEVVTNAAPYSRRTPTPVANPIRLIHAGAAQRFRRLELCIDAMRDVDGATLDLMLMPNEPAYLAELRQRAADIPSVQFRAPVPYASLVETMAEYDASLVVFPPSTFNLANTLPNKFFESVQARLALVIGPTPEMVTILDEYGLGLVTEDFGVGSLHQALARLDRGAVERWKRASDAAALPLSSERQVEGWKTAIARLVA
jgi:hypothetical protein